MVCLRRLDNLTQCGWRQCRITERNKGIEAIACTLNEVTARPAIRSGCQPMNPADNLGQTPWDQPDRGRAQDNPMQPIVNIHEGKPSSRP